MSEVAQLAAENNRYRSGARLAMSFASLGVVYGDIGTSPLYAFRAALAFAGQDGLTADEVMGLASLFVWALVIIVGLKYVLFLLRADNQGRAAYCRFMP